MTQKINENNLIIKKSEEEKKIIESKCIYSNHVHVAKVQELNKEIIEKGKELNIMKNKANARKEHGIKQFHSITIEAKKPEKIDSQNPLTVQLLKDMQYTTKWSFCYQ